MRKIVQIVALGTVLSGCTALLGQGDAQAQHERRGPMTPEQELANMTKALHLSSEQQAKLKPVLEERHAELMRMHEDKKLSRGQKSEHMKQVDEGANAKVLAVLNGDQKNKYQAMIEQRRERREAMEHNRNEGGSSQ